MMKKVFSAVVLIAVFYVIGKSHKSPSADPVFGLLPKSVKEKSPETTVKETAPEAAPRASRASDPVKVIPPSEVAALLRDQSDGTLFSYLFDGGFQQPGQLTPESLRAVQQRFSKAYSQDHTRHISMADREAINRIGILKAMGQSAGHIKDSALKAQVISFYERILATPHESLMVKRQALKSLAQTQTDLSEEERLRRLEKVDRHVLSLSAMSDREIVEAALEN
ncbi:hypothetical protein D3C87_701420 [compost metagenome]